MITASALHPVFAARLDGIDLRDPVGDDVIDEILGALDRYAVCVVPHDIPLTDEEHIAFSLRLGPIEDRPVLRMSGAEGMRIPRHEIIDQSNLDDRGEIYAEDDRRLAFKRANRQWHTDMSFHPIRATYSLLSAHIVPPVRADTQFVDMRAVYDALDGETKSRLKGLVGEHSYWHSRVTGGGPEPTEEELASRPPARHKLVHAHPRSGRKALYLASHIAGIEGMEAGAARALVAELMEFATQDRFVFRHGWTVGDVVIWDNLATMHRASKFDDRRFVRDMRRTTCREAPVAGSL